MTTLNDYVALQADHDRLRVAARRALDLLTGMSTAVSPADSALVEIREALKAELGAGEPAADQAPRGMTPAPVDENAPLSIDELTGLFGPTIPLEAGILIHANPDRKTMPEIRAELARLAASHRAIRLGPRRPAFLTHDDDNGEHRYYLAPESRAPAPYRLQRHVDALVDIAADGSFAGVELIEDMPPPYRG